MRSRKMSELIKVGDVFETINSNNVYGKEKLIIKKVENETSKDGYGYFDTSEKINRRKYNHRARVWWFLEYCRKIDFAKNKENGEKDGK
jgi:hypothetical protein